MSAEPGALPAAALEQVIRAVRDLDMEVRGNIARRKAEDQPPGQIEVSDPDGRQRCSGFTSAGLRSMQGPREALV